MLENLQVERADFQGALKRVQPSAMREIMIQVPDVTWDDVGGVVAAYVNEIDTRTGEYLTRD